MRRASILALVALLAAGGTGLAKACGDRLVVQGGGVHLDRVTRSRHPGSIVLLALRNAGAADTNDRLKIALARAGHEVRVVDSAEALDRALRERRADVVLAALSDAPALRVDPPVLEKNVAVVPLLVRPTRGELADARKLSSCIAPVEGWGVTPVLLVVDQVRARQADGQDAGCSNAARVTS
jgi:hypothetical protein